MIIFVIVVFVSVWAILDTYSDYRLEKARIESGIVEEDSE